MSALTAGPRTFLLNGREFFLYSGELHYFRVAAADWPRHLKAMKAAGLNTVSTYVCWDWHEYAPGKFDFTGKTDPRRNFVGFLAQVKKAGLFAIIKPGPYILAEYDGNGIPKRLLDAKQPMFGRNEQGKPFSTDVLTMLHPDNLAVTYRWYDKVMPIIAKHQLSRGGPIALLQVDNEVGLQHWLMAQADHNPAVIALYRDYLKKRFGTIAEYNRLSGERFSGFGAVRPPAGDVRDLKHFAAYYEWHAFWRHYFARFLTTLVGKIRTYGIDLQLTHNVAGWIYGSASEMPMILSFYADVMKECPEIVFGLDHIPEFQSFRNAHCDLPLNQMLVAQQGHGPVWAAEFQAGTREHQVRCDVRDMDLFYKASLAHDMRGLNFYMFSQGENPPGGGSYGKMFYWQTPLDVKGRPSPLYDVTAKLGRFLGKNARRLLRTETSAEIGVAWYPPYGYTEIVTSQLMARKKLDAGKIGLRHDPRFLRETVYYDGLLRCLQALNLNYRIFDLTKATPEEMARFKQVYVVAADYMDADAQERLATMVEQGGKLVLLPGLPRLDLAMRPCDVLRKRLGVTTRFKTSSRKISILGTAELYTASSSKEIYAAKPGEAIAWTEHKDVCGIERKVGRGQVTLIGAAVVYNLDSHLKLYADLAARGGVKRDVEVSDPDVNVVLRRGEGYGYLFALNYHGAATRVRVGIPKRVMKEMGCTGRSQFVLDLPPTSATIVEVK
jgi:beta-galactosidase